MKSLIAVAALAVATGCASLGSMPAGEPGPLRAYLLPHSSFGDISFHVSRPAHVAVFRIVPGGATDMVYPYSGVSSHVTREYAGFHSLGLGRRNDRFMFSSFNSGSPFGPEFYFLIASEEPLRLEQFGGFGSRLHNMSSSFGFGGGQFAMERLVELAVPNVADESWTTDYFVVWPEEQSSSRRPNMVQISCNGQIINVPAQSAAWAAQYFCGGLQENPANPPVDPGAPPTGTPEDSIIEPTRRDPVQPAERISSSQLTTPEVWDQLRTVAEEAAVTRSLSARERADADEFGSSDAARDYRRPGLSRSSGNSSNSGASSVESPRSRPSPEATARAGAASGGERDRPTPSDAGSSARPLAPTEPE